MQNLQGSLLNSNASNLVYENEMKLIHVCAEIERNGLLINRSYVVDGLRYEQDKIKEAKEEFRKDTGHEFRDSNKLFESIFKSRGERIAQTEKGNPSFAADILEDLDTPTAKLINKIRFHEKRASTYWTSFLYHADENDIIRPRLNQAGTLTGRFSSSEPNLQNVPKEDADEDMDKPFVIRGAFVPPAGHTIFSIDYSQLEYRIMADYAGETAVIKMINDGWDSHEAIGKITGLPRSLAKTVNFAILYGTGDEKLGKMIGKPKKEASEIRRLYFDRLPKVNRLLIDIRKTIESRGYIMNWLGRKCWLTRYEWSYAAPNWLIQGGGADICKRAMVAIAEKEFPGLSMRMQVHDELLFYASDSKHIANVKKIMESVYTPRNGINLVANISYSEKSWAARDLKKLALSEVS